MTRSGPADMTPEGPAHLVAWSWRCRMVGSPTVAAGTPPYPLLGSGRERFSGGASELLCSGEHPRSPDWILPYRLGAALGRKLCEVIWGLCAGSVRPSFGSRLASAVRSRLSLGPSATKLRAVRPAALHGNCRHDQPCLHTHAPADRPAWKLPSMKLLCREQSHLRLRAARPRRRAGELLGRVRAMPRY